MHRQAVSSELSGSIRISLCFVLGVAACGVGAAGPVDREDLGAGSRGRDLDVQTVVAESAGAPIVGSDTTTLSDASGYGKPNQSRIWFNSHQRRWDALVPKDDGGPSASDHYILKDVTGTQVFTALKLEDRNSARPDVFWIDDRNELFVLGSHGTTTRFWRLDYVEATDSYEVDPDVDGNTVPGITHAGRNHPAALYVTPNGHVWVAVMNDGALEVQQSTDGGRNWMPVPVLLDAGVQRGLTTWAHFSHEGRTYAGLFAGEDGEMGVVTALFYYWFIDQDADPPVPAGWTDDTANIPQPAGMTTSDDHVAAARDSAENQYFVVKTENGDPEDPTIRLFKRTAAGDWSAFTVTQALEMPQQTRPSLVVDEQNSEIQVYTTDTGGGDGRRVVASLGALEALSSAPAETVFSSPGKSFDDILSPRHAVNAASGVVVLAHNETDLNVWYSAAGIAGGSCMSAGGGTPAVAAVEIPQTDIPGLLPARIYRPDPELQTGACPLISMIPPLYGQLSDVEWAARRLAQDGYVVILTEPALGTFLSFDRAARSGIDYMLVGDNPWPEATDTSRVGVLGAPGASSALTQSQAVDPRIDAVVAWDNLAKSESGDRGSPSCFVFPGPTLPPRVPAMGQASDRCLKGRNAKKTAFDWWRSNGVETMQVVFARSRSSWWGPGGNVQEHERIHYYTLAWFDRWLKNDPSATERLAAREVLGRSVTTFLDWWYRSGAFFDGYDCFDLRRSCSQN